MITTYITTTCITLQWAEIIPKIITWIELSLHNHKLIKIVFQVFPFHSLGFSLNRRLFPKLHIAELEPGNLLLQILC